MTVVKEERMRRAAGIAVWLLAIGVVAASAQQKRPDLNGNWTLDTAKSTKGEHSACSLVVSQNQSSITMERVYQYGTGTGRVSQTFNLDGQPKRIEEGGVVAEGTARWEGDKLVTKVVVTGAVQGEGSGEWTLSPDGRTLTLVEVEKGPDSGGAEKKSTLVFVKQ
jgi:hypothetical protein